ncbi:general secretion pathway protein C [Aquabacterium sp. A08]|uniref:general secretion pathway protein C n=1 Tax=Aquabacterium sp. A08 TaxID=2718532 RepID=UPI0014205D35|nr:general secretion pathway protein C [Aquabacterium sp. A08]NIC42229.1 general secretion pathway protein C [Aquabacterium sp. A08]
MTNLLPFARGRTWGPRLLSWAVWGLVGGSVAHWGLRLAHSPRAEPLPASVAPVPWVDVQAMARALGGTDNDRASAGPPAASAAPVHTLLGVVAGAQGRGVALLLAPGEPVRPVRLGERLPDGWRLEALGRDHAVLAGPGGQGAATVRLPAVR